MSPEQAIQRVAQRVEQGGHGIPDDVIRRRFKKGLRNLMHLFMPICDSIHVWNNTQTPAQLIAEHAERQGRLQVFDNELWNKIIQHNE